MTKATPGPWRADGEDVIGRCGFILIDAGKAGAPGYMRICEAYGPYPDFRITDEVRANARLIAAAPELLEALEDIDAYISGGDMNDVDFGRGLESTDIPARVKAAIAKAEGRDQ